MNQQDELDWHMSAGKYYQSFRILVYLGYTKQALSQLLISIEKSLKILIAIPNNLSKEELKNKYGHNLLKLLQESNLKEKEFETIFKVCNTFEYNDLRYEFELVGNGINVALKKLDEEIHSLSRKIITEFNKKHNTRCNIGRFPTNMQDRKYKSHFQKMALTKSDKILRFDMT